MLLHLHPYAPHSNTRLELPATGLVTIHGANGSGKSSIVEAYAAAHWGRSLRGASPWRSPDCRVEVTHPSGLHVDRTPTDLLINGYGALKPSKKQPDLTALVGDFATWQRTRVFDADLTARFGAEGDSERKKLLEKLLGLEKLDAGLKRCRDDIREADRLAAGADRDVAVAATGLAEQPKMPTDFDAAALARCDAMLREVEQKARELVAAYWQADSRRKTAEHQQRLFHGGHCPTCEQPLPQARLLRIAETAAQAKREELDAEAAMHDAEAREQRLAAGLCGLRATQEQAQRASVLACRRAELAGKQAAAESKRALHASTTRQLRLVEAFIAQARTALLDTSLASLEAAASAWLPSLALRVENDGLLVKLGQRSYKELNEGHRRLCDLAVLLGLSSFGDAKVKGPIFLDGCSHGLDEDRQDAVAALLETVAERELVIVLTCVEDVARRLGGMHVRVANGRCDVIR